MDPGTLLLTEALARLGIAGAAEVDRARTALEAARLVNARKDRVSAAKVPRMREALTEAFQLVCTQPSCTTPGDPRPVLHVRREECAVCGGSTTKRAVERMVAACAAAGIKSVCVVGGSPSVREELRDRVGKAFKLTLVDGTLVPDSHVARAHVRGHDLVVIGGASELDHRLSGTYENCRSEGTIITVARRGVEAMADAVTRHAEGRAR